MAKRLKSSQTRVVLLVAVFVLVALFVGAFGPSLSTTITGLTYNPDTQRFTPAECAGYITGAGATGNTLPGELLDQSEYIASWSPNLIGQRVTTIGGIDWVNGPTGGAVLLMSSRLAIYLTWANNGTKILIESATKDFSKGGTGTQLPWQQWTEIQNTYWDILSPDGLTIIPEGSVVTSDLFVNIRVVQIFPLPDVYYNDCKVAEDQAVLHTGIGSIWWDRTPSLYQVGETATLNWQIGYISDPQKHLGWSLFITSQAQGSKTVFGPVTLTQLTGNAAYKVVLADWAPFKGVLTGYLVNELFVKDFSKAATIDNTSLAPSISNIAYTPQSPKQGQQVTITWTATPNSITKAPIDHTEIDWGYGGPTNAANVSGTTSTYTFTASQGGYLKIAINAWDTQGRPSGFVNMVINIQQQPPNLCLGTDQFCGKGGGPIPVWIFLVAAAVIALSLSAFLPTDMKAFKFKPFMRVVVVIIGIMLAAVAMVVYPG